MDNSGTRGEVSSTDKKDDECLMCHFLGALELLLFFLCLAIWEALPQDPFFVPKTEEEIEGFGDGSTVACLQI
jgi:hypothetical protein